MHWRHSYAVNNEKLDFPGIRQGAARQQVSIMHGVYAASARLSAVHFPIVAATPAEHRIYMINGKFVYIQTEKCNPID